MEKHPEIATIVTIPPALLLGSLGTAYLARGMTKKKAKKPKKLTKKAAAAGPPTLAKLRKAYPKRVATPRVANPRAVAEKMEQIEKGATIRGRIRYALKRLAAPIRQEKARVKASKAMDKGKTRKALRYGGVAAGFGPSFGREPKKAKKLLAQLRAAQA
jgi:hypothetical protein